MSPSQLNGQRMGNQMFNLAGILHVAQLTGRRAVVPRHRNWWIGRIFDIDLPLVDNIELELCPCVTLTETRCCAYEQSWSKTLRDRSDLANRSVLLRGFTYSWLYTVGVESQLRRQLRPNKNLSEEVCSYLNSVRPARWRSRWQSIWWSTAYVTVGVHIRAGDMASADKFAFGYTIPKLPYFEQAIEYIVNHDLRGEDKNARRPVNRRIQLIVACENVDWCRSMINLTSVIERWTESSAADVDIDLVYSKGRSAAFDMLILSQCDALIMTTGTFGWWAGCVCFVAW